MTHHPYKRLIFTLAIFLLQVTLVHASPNDPLFGLQWAIKNNGQSILTSNGSSIQGFVDADIDADAAWNVTTGSSSVVIAVLDTGIDVTHPDIKDNLWLNIAEIANNGIDDDGNGYIDDVNGWDFVHDDNRPVDLNGHGTHVSGVIAARGDNASTVAGISWNSKIMPLQITGADGVTTTAAILSAIYYAVDNGAKIINASYGQTTFDQDEYDAYAYANSMGVLVVAAACNNDRDNDVTPCYPASYDLANIISVAASDQFDNRASFSNWGAVSVDLAAPGVNIISTFPRFSNVWMVDFAAGQQGWSFGGTQNQWALNGGLLQDSPAGPYADNTNSWAMSPAINLNGQSSCRASVGVSSVNLESNIDKLYIEGSTDGVTWRTMGQLLLSSQLNLGKYYADISEYDGSPNFYIRFRLSSNSVNAFDGVSISDVAIECYGQHDQNSYIYWNGTSTAAPFVSGTAALMLSQNATLTLTELKSRMLNSVDKKTTFESILVAGGRLNVAQALGTTETSSTTGTSAGGGGALVYTLMLIFIMSFRRRHSLFVVKI